MLTIETIKDLDRLESLSGDWDRLAESVFPRLPFASPLWALNWWRSFRRTRLIARDALHAYALRDETRELVAIAPMFVTSRPGFGPVRMRELQFFGADPYVTEWRGLICRPDRVEEAAAALAAHIRQENPADVVQWRGLPAALDPQAFGRDFQARDHLSVKVFYLDLPESWEAFRAGLPRNVKESLRKCYNSLARDKLEFSFRVVRAPEETPAALDDFFRLHAQRADARDRIRHPDVFADAARRDFLRSYCEEMARREKLRIFQLVIAGRVVATRIGFLFGDEIYMYFSGYDLAWSHYSVMTTTVAEAIKWAIGQRLRIFNLSTGADVSKTRWRPQVVDFVGGYSVGAGGAVLALSALEALRRRRDRAIRGLAASGRSAAQGA